MDEVREFDFTYSSYRRLLKIAGKRFRIVTAKEILENVSDTWLFIRHDVDNSLELALEMASIEESLGIVTTYYLMTSSSVYNSFAPISRAITGRLLEMGHQIGLHFCLKTHTQCDRRSIIESVVREKSLLESIFQTRVCTVSFHQPGQVLANPTGSLKSLDFSLKEYGLLNTYSSEDTQGAFYLSDSKMSFSNGINPLTFFASTNVQRTQLLAHPIWYDKEVGEAEERWDRMLLLRIRQMIADKIENEHSMNQPRVVDIRRL